MKQYIKAEWELYKKNTLTLLFALIGLALFVVLLILSGIGGAQFSAVTAIVGYVDFLFFIMALYFSPASFWKNRQKVAVTSEQLLLTLGESKRTYIKIRLMAFFVLYFGMVLVIVLMQLPSYWIAGKWYSLWYFGIELAMFTAFVFLTMPAMYLIPARWLSFVLPGWSGFCGGIMGSILGDSEEFADMKGAFYEYLAFAIIGVILGVFSMVYRYGKTVREERRTVRKAR